MTTRRLRRLLFLLLLLAGAAVPALAGTATLLRDAQPGGASQDSNSGVTGRSLSLGPVALLPITEASSGQELWVSDGTDAGTRPLLDFCPGPCASGISFLGQVRGTGVFQIAADIGDSSVALWRSDGTRPGTFPLAGPAGAPERCELNRDAAGSASTQTAVYFFAGTGSGCGLWRTDGTSARTVPVRQITSGDEEEFFFESVYDLITVGGNVFFLYSRLNDGVELWRSDGTERGTVPLHAWTSGHAPSHLIAAGSRLFFLASSGADGGRELWASDGTPAGTRPVTAFAPTEPFVLREDFGSRFVIQAVDAQVCLPANDGATGRELWCSDGTPAGTRRVTEFTLASPFVELLHWRIEKLGQRLVFPANDGASGNRLWTTTGQPASTARIDGCPGGCPQVASDWESVRAGSRLYFQARNGTELWATDGTGAGTRRIDRICESFCRFSSLTPLFGQLFFTAPDDRDETFLWRTDGTAEGTVRIVSLGSVDSGADGITYPPVTVGERALLALADEDSEKPQLWVSDGTPAGTRQVTRIAGNGLSSSPRSLVPAGDGVRFLAAGGGDIYGLWTSQGTEASTVLAVPGVSAERLLPLGALTIGLGEWEVWRSDGTPAGTFPLVTSSESLPIAEIEGVALPGRVVFSLQHFDAPEYTLWSTDGTVAGTRKIFDLPAGESYLYDLTAVDGKAFFVVGRSNSETQLWETDGTAAGTRRLTPQDRLFIDTPLRVARLGSTVFFVGNDGSSSLLWRTDGTFAGTRAVTEGKTQTPGELATHQGSVYFFAHSAVSPFAHGLWKSDGTEAGTVGLREFPAFDSFSVSPQFTSFGPFLYFVSAGELWRTDGTAEGTVLVRDIVPGPDGSFPRDLTPLGGKLYFGAGDRVHGRELWETDGTEEGTRPVTDIAPGAFSSDPEELVAAGGKLFFAADDGVHGREPWVYVPTGSGCQATEHALCLGGRFRVEADWRDFEGGSGRGQAVALTADTGYFWFFEPSNVEVILKVLDGQGLNGHHWVFYGALSSVEYTLTVTDTQTGAVRRYINPSGLLGSVADTQAFGPLGASLPGVVTTGPAPASRAGEARVSVRSAPATGSCAPSSTRLCLNDGRFAVEARWKDFEGKTGVGRAVPLPGGDTGYFWFFDDDNVEVVLKVLDGRPLNGKFWVFYGALSTVEYTLTVTDTVTGTVKTYTNPSGSLASVADTGAF